MERKKKKIKKSTGKRKNYNSYNSLFILLLIALMFIGGVHLYQFIKNELRSFTEISKDDTRKVPSEVNKKITPNYSPSYRVPILMYHYVEYVTDKKDLIRQSLNIEPNIFEAQVKTLRNNGYTFMTAKELGEIIDDKKIMPPKPILLTFDDGHYDLDTVILPILKKYNAKATAYIIPGFIDQPDFLTKLQLQNVIESQLVDVGAHTVHHIYLKGKILPITKYEVSQSKKMLEKDYHISVVSFAYPDGAFDQQTIDVVKNAGFTTAVTTIPKIVQTKQNKFFLFRLRPGYRTGNDLLKYFNQTEFKPY